jgi:hypothetical protein
LVFGWYCGELTNGAVKEKHDLSYLSSDLGGEGPRTSADGICGFGMPNSTRAVMISILSRLHRSRNEREKKLFK